MYELISYPIWIAGLVKGYYGTYVSIRHFKILVSAYL